MPLLLVARLFLTLSTSYQVCADNPRTHHEYDGEHKHVVAFASATGVEDGDYIIFIVSGFESAPLSPSGSRVEFPAGLGVHYVVVRWFRHDGRLKKEVSESLHVYPWSSCQ